MAYMSQDRKKQLMPGIKAALKQHGFKGSVRVDNHMTLCLTVTEGPFREADGWYRPVNHYWFEQHDYPKHVKAFLRDVLAAMNDGNWDKSDPMTDYFNVGWYVEIQIGRWNKPFKHKEA